MTKLSADKRSVEIDGKQVRLSLPVEVHQPWIGQEEALTQLLAAWSVIDEEDYPLTPRLLGKPGVGKTTLAMAAANTLEVPVYIMQATSDTRPEDLLIIPVLNANKTIDYVASPIVSAMLTGGVVVLDEGNRMSEKAWASLASLLDHRRYVESVIMGSRIHAAPGFRMVATMNQDSSTYTLPDYIHSRLQPQLYIDFASIEDEQRILEGQLPFLGRDWILYLSSFLESAHQADEPFSLRDAIQIGRFAGKLARAKGLEMHEAVREAISHILGDDAVEYL